MSRIRPAPPHRPRSQGGTSGATRAALLATACWALVATGSLAQTAVTEPPAQPPSLTPSPAPGPVPGGEPNLSQTGIPAEATAENAVLARDKAFAAARRLAWDRMRAAAGLSPQEASPAQLERLVSSIVIEQERVTPTRYSGRLTVNFVPGAVRASRGGGSGGGPAGSSGGGGGGGAKGSEDAGSATPTRPAAVATLEVVAQYRSLAEWVELRRRLLGAAPVATVDIVGITVASARLRLGLRQSPAEAAGELEALGVALSPADAVGGPPVPASGWRVRLAGG